MKDKFPEIYKNKINNLKTKVQNTYYYNHEKKDDDIKEKEEEPKNNNYDIRSKINAIFKKPNFVYQADVNIMYKNGENITTTIIGFKDDHLLTKDGKKININEIKNIN